MDNYTITTEKTETSVLMLLKTSHGDAWDVSFKLNEIYKIQKFIRKMDLLDANGVSEIVGVTISGQAMSIKNGIFHISLSPYHQDYQYDERIKNAFNEVLSLMIPGSCSIVTTECAEGICRFLNSEETSKYNKTVTSTITYITQEAYDQCAWTGHQSYR